MAEVITRFKLETTQFDSKLRDASKGLSEFTRQAKEGGSGFTNFSQKAVESARALGTIASGATNTKDKLKDLVGAYNDAARAYNKLSQEQQQSDFGKALSVSMGQLKDRITETKNEIYGLGNATKGNLGQFGNLVDDLGHKIGLSGNLTELLTSKTALLTGAIGAGTTAVVAATKAWADYNSEIAKQDQITTVTTGLKGSDADKMTEAARSIARVYGSDFREVINAANTLMSQFGQTGEEAIQTLRDGMQGMIQGDGPKLLSMIQQYAPAFRDAGVSASQLVAVIQNSEGGIFTDQNMSAIVMGIKNIRLMTENTSAALAKLGIDGQKMSEQLSDGSLTIFDALKQVATQIQTVDSNSKAAGEVMQTVFGRQGAMAGTNLGKAIAELNTNLEETKRQTGEVGESFANLEEANERLEKAIRDCFGYDGWQTMATGIKTELVSSLASVLEITQQIKDSWVGDIGGTIFDGIKTAALESLGPLGQVLATLLQINNLRNGGEGGTVSATGGGGAAGGGGGGGARGGSVTPVVKPPVVNIPISRSGGGRRSTGTPQKSDLEMLKERTGNVDYSQFYTAAANRKEEIELPVKPVVVKQSPEEMKAELDAMYPTNDPFELPVKPVVKDAKKDMQDFQKAANLAASAVSSIGEAFASIEDPSTKAAGMVIQAVASIALGFATASAQANTAGTGWGWLAWLAAGAAAMATTISTIHSLTGYAQGGIVEGNSYSGDNIPIMANAGEVVLTKAMTNSLANQLQENGGGVRVSGEIHGETIVLAVNRYLKRSGKGELVTWK